jgi:beta-lactamase class A
MLELKRKITEELLGFEGRAGLAVEIGNERFHYNSSENFPSAIVIKIPSLIEAYSTLTLYVQRATSIHTF